MKLVFDSNWYCSSECRKIYINAVWFHLLNNRCPLIRNFICKYLLKLSPTNNQFLLYNCLIQVSLLLNFINSSFFNIEQLLEIVLYSNKPHIIFTIKLKYYRVTNKTLHSFNFTKKKISLQKLLCLNNVCYEHICINDKP